MFISGIQRLTTRFLLGIERPISASLQPPSLVHLVVYLVEAMKSSLLRFVALVAAPVAAEIQIYKYGLNSTATLSNGCTEALKGALDCDPYLQSLAAIDYYGPVGNNTLQDVLCAASCGSSLSEYHDSIHKACANDPQPWDGIPASWVSDIIWATYNRTCLKDEISGEYCTSKFCNLSPELLIT